MAFKVFVLNRIGTNRIVKELNGVLKIRGRVLTDSQIKRIHYSTALSCITNSWFSTLRGTKLSSKEKSDALYIGAITPLIDDLTDSLKHTSYYFLNELKKNTKDVSIDMLLPNYIYKKLFAVSNAELHQLFDAALTAHDVSVEQLNKQRLSDEKLKEITYTKGGFTTFVYRMALCHPLKTGEKDAVYTLGYLMQLINDAFDVYKDFKNRQQTLFTNTSDIKKIHTEFETANKKMLEQFIQLGYKESDTKKFLTQVSTIIARGKVCFDVLLNCQETTNDVFKIDSYTREQLICDMEKLSNIRKAVNYSNSSIYKS